MAYNAKTDWKYDDNITENDVNRWEQGIADAHEKADQAEQNAKEYTDQQVDAHKADDMRHIPENGQMRKIVKAYPNTSYTIPQIRNIIISPSDADINSMDNGDIWIKYK